MPRFDSFTISRFRGLRYLHFEGLGAINLLVGGNNSGKTSVLEALAMFCEPLSPDEWISIARLRETAPYAGLNMPKVEVVEWLFPHDDGLTDGYQGAIDLSAMGSIQVSSLGALLRRREEPFDEPAPEKWLAQGAILRLDAQGIPIRVGIEIDVAASDRTGAPVQGHFEYWAPGEGRAAFQSRVEKLSSEHFEVSFRGRRGPELLLKLPIPVELVTSCTHRSQALSLRALSDATLGERKEEVVELLQTFDPNLVGFEILSPEGLRSKLYLRDARRGLLPHSVFGDGVRRVLFLAAALSRVRGGVLLIDEIESAIHVSALGRAFKWLCRACEALDVQLFATTHSLEAIDALLGAETAPIVTGFRLPSIDGSAPLKRYDGALLQELRHEHGLDVR